MRRNSLLGCDEIPVEKSARSENLSFLAVCYPPNHITVMEKTPEVHPAQPPVQNKPNFKARLGYSEPCPGFKNCQAWNSSTSLGSLLQCSLLSRGKMSCWSLTGPSPGDPCCCCLLALHSWPVTRACLCLLHQTAMPGHSLGWRPGGSPGGSAWQGLTSRGSSHHPQWRSAGWEHQGAAPHPGLL